MNGLRGVVLRRKRRGQRGEKSHGGCADRIHGCGYDTAVQNRQTSPLPFLTENSPGARAGIGAQVLRKEDARLLTGGGCYSDDVNLPGQAHAVMVRSPHAHARIGRIDAVEATALPGVLAVLTGADFAKDGLKSIPHRPFSVSPPDVRLQNRDGSEIFIAPHWPLPADKARFVGEAVTMVVAETVRLARDAAELVRVDYESLAGAPVLWEERVSNVNIDADLGDARATEAAFARAAHVVRLETRVQRVTGVPMEPRAALAAYDPALGRYTLYAGSGGVVRQKRELA